ncbi:hypothetical protein HGG82_00440 [Marinomonas sp. M1K-6]|uniref:Uncharacterized protein n=1 Tax=Marinomonas profundi TaxID=2726122 RepID=A0A847QUK0_9GAMM|nr:hypothetical protein [Marinomonas profundi]NLQ16088.1 hypothetical protein [Marinomonas profundi]UDV03325.1 hypothetical protein J8N69_00560 [Marinomonas profundi]
MNKKQFLNTYKKIDALDEEKDAPTENPSIYRSKHDERLIKDFHYAKFQKNLNNAQQSQILKDLLNKENWDEKDTEKLLQSLR